MDGPAARHGGRRIVILHDPVAGDAPPDQQDTLDQVREVATALRTLGYRVASLAMAERFETVARVLSAQAPHAVFNLVETGPQGGRSLHLAPTLLESLDLPFTGCGSTAFHRTTGKLLAKRILAMAGIATPDWLDPREIARATGPLGGLHIVKSVWEDASIGIEPSSLVDTGEAARRIQADRHARFGGEWFAERFVDGREFNVGLLAGGGGPVVLPIAEIAFAETAAPAARIVDYAAKWEPDSTAWRNTPSTFEIPEEDDALLARLRRLAVRCWEIFGLEGYARVDFRVDRDATPWVIEVNANPCLAADAGFARAARVAGLDLAAVVERLLAAALARHEGSRGRAA